MEAIHIPAFPPRGLRAFKPIVVVVLVTFIAGTGCFGISRDRYSKPSVEGTVASTVKEPYVGDMYVVGDVAFHIFPLNSTGTDVMVFPIPHRFAEPSVSETSFSIGLALKTGAEGYAFSPASVKYWSDPAARISASSIQGPFGCRSSKPRPPTRPVAVTSISLAARTCLYMWLNFDTATPDPAQTFFVALRLRLHDEDIELPVIRFQQANRTRTFAVP